MTYFDTSKPSYLLLPVPANRAHVHIPRGGKCSPRKLFGIPENIQDSVAEEENAKALE